MGQVKTKSKVPKGAPPSKRPGANNTPARQRYWSSGRLEKRKVKAIMENDGCTRAEAYIKWTDARQWRRMKK